MTAHIDFERTQRLGFPEVIYGEKKSNQQLQKILSQFAESDCNALVTRLQDDKATFLSKLFPKSFHNSVAKTLTLIMTDITPTPGRVMIISGGSCDESVAMEAAETLNFLGVESKLALDKGVAGIHRTFAVLKEIKEDDIVIAIAGFEGALPSILGGMAANPIIAVPTSVGYGVATGGNAALNGMLASCANGIVVTNIDNGFGAAIAAFRILNGRKNVRT